MNLKMLVAAGFRVCGSRRASCRSVEFETAVIRNSQFVIRYSVFVIRNSRFVIRICKHAHASVAHHVHWTSGHLRDESSRIQLQASCHFFWQLRGNFDRIYRS